MTMSQQGQPYQVNINAGDTAYICQCGLSKNAPYCDGSHSGQSQAQPLAHTAQQDETLWICGCGKTGNQPFCDGSHQ